VRDLTYTTIEKNEDYASLQLFTLFRWISVARIIQLPMVLVSRFTPVAGLPVKGKRIVVFPVDDGSH